MRLLLIRHGETVHNVAGIYAGITDSALTNHGVLQANRLGIHLSATDVKISHIFSSDLQRAFRTAESIRNAQSPAPSATVQLELLREQDFGFYEGKQFFDRPKEGNKSGKEAHTDAHRNDPGFKDVESRDSMRIRSEKFIDEHLLPLLDTTQEDLSVAVVAHGIILSHLWRAFLRRFHPRTVSVAQGLEAASTGFSLEHLGGWSNTGYLHLEVKSKAGMQDMSQLEESNNDSELLSTQPSTEPQDPAVDDPTLVDSLNSNATKDSTSLASELPQKPSIPPPSISTVPPTPSTLLNMSLVVKAVNSTDHLAGLKKTRGGIGSLKHDSNQRTVDSFFKKRRIE